jgi:hypothetical protein
MSDRQREIKCEGRFVELRTNIAEALDIVCEGNPCFGEAELDHVYRLLEEEFGTYDTRDNYFQKDPRDLRKNPPLQPASLVPLLARDVNVTPGLVRSYVKGIAPGASPQLEDLLSQFGERPFMEEILGRPSGFEPRGYRFKTNFGIGNRQGEAVVSDSPFNLELWEQTSDRMNYEHALTLGFWVYRHEGRTIALVDQIQEARRVLTRPNKQAGIISARYLCAVGKELGLDEVRICPAWLHPMFFEHPERRGTKLSELKGLYDRVADELAFGGLERTGYYHRLEDFS